MSPAGQWRRVPCLRIAPQMKQSLRPRRIGIVHAMEQVPDPAAQRNAAGLCRLESAMARIAVAATTPARSPLVVKRPGATGSTCAWKLEAAPDPDWTANATEPGRVPPGTWKLI